MPEPYLMIGEIVKPQGVSGEVKVKPYTDDLERFHELPALYMQDKDGFHPVEARCTRVHEGMVYLRVEGIHSANDAEQLRGQGLYVARGDAAPLSADENYIADLIGCTAYDEKGNVLGVLADILTHCPTHVYIFKTETGSLLLPALKRVITDVDVARKRMTIDSVKLQEVAVFED